MMDQRKSMYEHISILSGNLKQQEIDDEIEKYKKFFEENDIKVNSFKNLGLKNLAYEIRGNKQGNYFFFKLETTSDGIRNLEKFTRESENTIKFIDVRTDDEIEERENEEEEEEEED